MKRIFLVFLGLVACCSSFAGLTVHVSYLNLDGGPKMLNGRVVLFLSRRRQDPRKEIQWFNPEPIFSRMVTGLTPETKVELNAANTVGFPMTLDSLKPGKWYIQAVMDFNLGGRSIGDSPGNMYSGAAEIIIDPEKENQSIDLECSQVISETKFHETPNFRAFTLKSKLLSQFYGRDFTMKAGVYLPVEYEVGPKDQKFPVLYMIPGFGGTYKHVTDLEYMKDVLKPGGIPFIVVLLDPNCPGGHSVFADSENNGPWGAALTTEFIPSLEQQFRCIGTNKQRYLTGHSSGGWSSLWLQVAYPEFFNGVWSTSPDPVDFRNFQYINLYSDANMFTDAKGERRPLARVGEKPLIWYKDFSDMERPLRGEQLYSFEAAFSKKGANGEPVQLWNRDTGEINHAVAETWKKYDINRILVENWSTLGPKLKGKLHVYMGETDTFYLEGAVKLLKADMAKLDPSVYVGLWPGDHGSVMSKDLLHHIALGIAERFKAAGGVPAKGMDLPKMPAKGGGKG